MKFTIETVLKDRNDPLKTPHIFYNEVECSDALTAASKATIQILTGLYKTGNADRNWLIFVNPDNIIVDSVGIVL